MRAGIRGASASHAVIRALGSPSVRAAVTGRLHVFAAGKAAGSMSAALLTDHTLTVKTILATGTHRLADLSPRVTWFEGSHPFPDERSVAAGRAGLTLASRVGADETLVLLLSGGASALAAVPADGITLAEKRRAIELMMHAGADIHALNTVRKHLSAIKGGRLAAATRAPCTALVISDVIGDDLSVIASGPTVADASRFSDAVAIVNSFAARAGEFPPLSFKEIASKRTATGGPIVAAAAINAEGQGPGFAAQFCDVEVDPETGAVKILRFVAAQDAGRAVHPTYVEGQIQGGVVQGIGWALNEEYIYNRDGRLENPGFLDYRIPVTSDVPMIETIVVEVPNPNHPYGVKGVAEANIVPPMAAIANAINQAIGVRLTQLPMSPPKVLQALDS